MSEHIETKLSPSMRKVLQANPKLRTLVLVAQAGKAKLMEHRGSEAQLVLVESFANPEGQMQTNELVSDRPGRMNRGAGSLQRSATEQEESPEEHVLSVFVKKLTSIIDLAVAKGECDKIVLIAEPHCLGKLKSSLSVQAGKRVSATFDKDMFRLGDQELYDKLRETLHSM